MKTRLVRIGNSRGVRLPKVLIQQSGLTEEVELRVGDGTIVIARAVAPRSRWADAAKQARKCDEDLLLDRSTATRFDKQEWKW